MTEALLVSNAVLWVLVVLLACVVAALARQIGVLHERVAPAGALMVGKGPAVGEPAPVVRALDLTGTVRDLGGPGAEHAPLLSLADLPRLQDAPPGAAPGRAPRGRLARDRARQRRRAGRARGVRARRAPRGVPVRALAGARHHLPGGEAALRGAARRVGRRALARAREHTRAPREPVRGQGARRGVDPGFPP